MDQKAESLFQLAMRYIYGNGVPEDNALAAKLLAEAAALGHIEAAYNQGICYHYGYGTEIDLKKAWECYLFAAQSGYGRGMDLIGRFYCQGIYVMRDYEKALSWFMKAAESDDRMAAANAEYEIGQCYLEGYGVPRSRSAALEWYRRAAAHGNEQAKKALEWEESNHGL